MIGTAIPENGHTSHDHDHVLEQIAGFGTSVEVIDPPLELCNEFRRIASELVGQWL
jgi:hypothetical protein